VLTSSENELNIFGVPGSGKTEFACSLAKEAPALRFLYLSFGRENTVAAQNRTPDNVDCFSFHSFAFNRLGINSSRVRGKLTMSDAKSLPYEILSELDSMAKLEAFLILTSRFSESRLKLNESLRLLEERGVYPHLNIQDKASVFRALKGYFNSSFSGESQTPITHNLYLKRYSLSRDILPYDALIVDEAQDLNPAMFSVIEQIQVSNPNIRVVKMGDPMQQIFGFIGSCSDFTNSRPHLRLNKSNRFGEPLASFVNDFCNKRFSGDFTMISGNGSETFVRQSPSTKDIVTHAKIYPSTAVIARYNATLWNWMRLLTKNGITFHLVGNLFEKEISFIKALYALLLKKKTVHPALKGTTYSRFKKNAQANDIRDQILACKFIESIKNTPEFLNQVERLHTNQKDAAMSLSTVHQAKGLEFPFVWIAGDHKNLEESFTSEEFKVLYTAMTRAKQGLFTPAGW
jgi:hypothetical protein